ncbi:MAG: hydrogenase formation protein HypD [Candidatus Verstraetearchaeota archaeon]|nr:hydrogenase formation protein HypD [Candidatus Verstraetearchaeota archaeon]
MLARYRDRGLVRTVAERVAQVTAGSPLRIMHVCGTHEWAITHNGLRELLPRNVEVVAGPGCPVCVTPGGEIDAICGLALSGKAVVTTFGDVLRVPGANRSLAEAKASGADIRVVYGVSDAVRMASEEPERDFVHFSIGFETTAPTAAIEIMRFPPRNFSIFSSHKLIPPAMEYLLRSGAAIDGFICPGHVSTIIGAKAYEGLAKEYSKPMAVAGFEPLDIMLAILSIALQRKRGVAQVYNEYARAVRYLGNELALRAMETVFVAADAEWRGIGKIPGSGLKLREEYSDFDACVKHGMGTVGGGGMPQGCSCGEVLLGSLRPEECPLFGGECRPDRPVGPCMVSLEGTCAIAFKYSGLRGRR